MIEEDGRVVATDGAFAWVETVRQSACGHCESRGGCGTSAVAQVVGQKPTRVRALNEPQARVGESVIVGLDEGAMLRGSFMLYTVPLLLMIAAAVAADTLLGGGGELPAIAGGLVGLATGFALVRRHAGRTRGDRRYQPVILRRTLQPVGLRPAITTTMMDEE